MLKLEQFEPKFSPKWWARLRPFFESKEAEKIYNELGKRAKEGAKILPQSKDTFKAFSLCEFENVKMVVIGQSPYSTLYKNCVIANGVAFDCEYPGSLQPSLEYLWYSIKNSLKEPDLPTPAYLSWLAGQGILFLNYSLTVEQGSNNTSDLWEPFYKYLFEEVMSGTSGIIYILMGGEAKKLEKYINTDSNHVLKTSHPSFAARNKDTAWTADNVWSEAQEILKTSVGEYYMIDYHYTKYTDKLEGLPF